MRDNHLPLRSLNNPDIKRSLHLPFYLPLITDDAVLHSTEIRNNPVCIRLRKDPVSLILCYFHIKARFIFAKFVLPNPFHLTNRIHTRLFILRGYRNLSLAFYGNHIIPFSSDNLRQPKRRLSA